MPLLMGLDDLDQLDLRLRLERRRIQLAADKD